MSGAENGQVVVGGWEWAAAHKSKTAKGQLSLSAPHLVTASIASTWWPSWLLGMRPRALSFEFDTRRMAGSPAALSICSRRRRPFWVTVWALCHASELSSRSHLVPSASCASSRASSLLRVMPESGASVFLNN